MNTRSVLSAAALAMLCCGAFSVARADVPAKVELSSGVIECKLRWMPASKKYMIIRGVGGQAMEQQVDPSEILRKQVAPPADWKELEQLVYKNPDAALPKLLQIVDEYKMLEYDERAAYYAATLYMKKGKPEEAIKVCEKVTQDNPAAASLSQMAPVYWSALLATGKTSGGNLDKMIAEAITSAPRSIAAQALIARGDSLKKAGRTRDALKDGYLRCALLYTQEKDANAEALYKASLAFDELRQATYAERMRQTLLTKHRNSEFARKLRGN